MSLLDQANAEVTLYPEEVTTDVDGNTRTRPSKVGVPLKVWLAPIGRTMYASPETGAIGFETSDAMRMRLLRKDTDLHVGAQAQVEIDGKRWSVDGDAVQTRMRGRTKRAEYILRRS